MRTSGDSSARKGRRLAPEVVVSYFAGVLGASTFYILTPLLSGHVDLKASDWAAWLQAFGAVAGIGVAIWLPYAQRNQVLEAARTGQLETIAVDVTMAMRQARVYLNRRYVAPAYRLELNGRGQVLTSLLATGVLTSDDASHLVQFYVDASSFNFCLDRLQAKLDQGADHDSEWRRALTKAEHLIPGTKLSRYDPAVRVLKRLLPRESLERLALLKSPPSED